MMSTARRVLLIEDDQSLADAVAALLGDEGYDVTIARDGEEGLRKGLTSTFDVIVLDLMLPKMNGFSVCIALREKGIETPLLMLTAKDGELDEVEGFDVGADDFLRKPFERAVLTARLNALLRRHDRDSSKAISVGHVHLDLVRHQVRSAQVNVELTPREYTLLEYLMESSPQVKSKAQILNAVWGSDFDGDPNIVEVYIGYLRKKLDVADTASIIRTIRGAGYCAQVV